MIDKRVILSIAGSDSSGGAGIQCDIKTASALSYHCCVAVTCVTAQSNTHFQDLCLVPVRYIESQISIILESFDIQAIKIGMLVDVDVVRSVITIINKLSLSIPIIFDPVLRSSSGKAVYDQQYIDTIINDFLPYVTLVTPNIFEAGILANTNILSVQDMVIASKKILSYQCAGVLVKGSHLSVKSEVTDVLVYGDTIRYFAHTYIPVQVRGTGCCLSTAMACFIADGYSIEQAVIKAEEFILQKIKHSIPFDNTDIRLLAFN